MAAVDDNNSIELTPFDLTPRLIHLFKNNSSKKWPDSDEYKFKIVGNTVISVDENGPAFATGLKPDDIIIEINSNNVISMNTHMCNARVRANQKYATLLVVTQNGYNYFTSKNIPINCHMENILYKRTPRGKPSWQTKYENECRARDLFGQFINGIQTNIKTLQQKQNTMEVEFKTKIDSLAMMMENKGSLAKIFEAKSSTQENAAEINDSVDAVTGDLRPCEDAISTDSFEHLDLEDNTIDVTGSVQNLKETFENLKFNLVSMDTILEILKDEGFHTEDLKKEKKKKNKKSQRQRRNARLEREREEERQKNNDEDAHSFDLPADVKM